MSTWKPSEDAFGQEMLAFQSGHDVQEIIERDDGSVLSGYKSNNSNCLGMRCSLKV